MLLNLSVELMVNITSYLTFSDRLNLSLVNQQAQRIISQHALHQAIVLVADQEATIDIIGRFTRNILNGNPVKHLEINLNHLPNEMYQQLPAAFPNVACLVNLAENENPRSEHVVLPMQRWANTLKKYDITRGRLLLDRFMLTTPFPNMRSLTLSSQVSILELLRHMPGLQHLHIYNVMLNITYFENIHRTCPELKSMKISNAFVLVTNTARLPTNVQPFTTLTSLVLDRNLFIIDNNAVFLDYIIEKYINLENFELLTVFDTPHAQALLTAITARNLYGLHFTIQDFEDTHRHYQNIGGIEFLRRLPVTMNRFTLELSLFRNVYINLHLAHLNLTEVRFNGYTNNIENGQINLFRTFHNLTKLTATFDDIENPFTNHWSSAVLETMNITIQRRIDPNRPMQQRILNFIMILVRFPSLKNFTLDANHSVLTAEESQSIPRTFPNLRKLQLNRCSITPIFLSYLRRNKADIDSLDYPMTRLVSTSGRDFGIPLRAYDITLPNYSLETLRLSQLFNLREEDNEDIVHLRVVVNASNVIGRYHFDITRNHQIIGMEDVTNLDNLPEQNEQRITITVTLENLTEFKLEGHLQNITLHANPN